MEIETGGELSGRGVLNRFRKRVGSDRREVGFHKMRDKEQAGCRDNA